MKFYIDHMLDLIRENACCGLRAKGLVYLNLHMQVEEGLLSVV